MLGQSRAVNFGMVAAVFGTMAAVVVAASSVGKTATARTNGKSLWWGGYYTGQVVLCSGLVDAGRAHTSQIHGTLLYYYLSVRHIMGIHS